MRPQPSNSRWGAGNGGPLDEVGAAHGEHGGDLVGFRQRVSNDAHKT